MSKDNKSEMLNGMGMGFGATAMLQHPAFRMPQRQEKRAPGERNTTARTDFLKEVNDAIQRCDKAVIAELSNWLKVNTSARPGAIIEKLDSQQALHAKLGSGMWGSNESKAFSEVLVKLIKENHHTLFMMADLEIEEWTALANDLSSQLSILQGQDTKSITDKLDAANAQVLQLTRDAATAKIELEKKQAEIERIQEALKKIEAEKVTSQADMEKLRESVRKLELDSVSLTSQLQASQSLVSKLDSEKSELKAENGTLKTRLDEETRLSATKDIELAKLKAEADGYKSRLEDATKRIAHLERQDIANTENQKGLVTELRETRQDLNSTRDLNNTRDTHNISGRPKQGNGGFAVPSTPAPRDTVPVQAATLSRNSRGLVPQTPQASTSFFQAAAPQVAPAPNLLNLDVVFLPACEIETTHKAKILEVISYIKTRNFVSDSRLKAVIALTRFLVAVPSGEQDSVVKFALESIKQLASQETGHPNNPAACLNVLLENIVALKGIPGIQPLCDELTKLAKEDSKTTSQETLNASRLQNGLRNLFEDNAYNIVVLRDYFKAQKYTFEAQEKQAAGQEAKPNDSADASRSSSTINKSGAF